MTVYMLDGEFGVCSRNLDLIETEGNTFWKMARLEGIEQALRAANLDNIAIQGELIGEGIQGNKYKLKGHQFRVFDIYSVAKGHYLDADNRSALCTALGLQHCPTLDEINFYVGKDFEFSVENFLDYAEGKSMLNQDTEREGVVFKCIEDPSLSFKVISNKFLLKGNG